MEIDEIFDTLCLRVAEIELYRSVARETTRPVVKRLAEIAQTEADQTGDVSLPFSVQSMGGHLLGRRPRWPSTTCSGAA